MSILLSFLSPIRALFMALDGIAFSLLDNAYELVIKLSDAEIIKQGTIKSIMQNLYILFGVISFFKLAMLLINSIIDPEKLSDKGKGLSNTFFRVVGMLIILAVTPMLFQFSFDIQKKIVSSDANSNLIFKIILGDQANIGGTSPGKALQNIALSSLITVDDTYAKLTPLECKSNGDGTCTNEGGYEWNDKCDWSNCENAISEYNTMYVNEEMSPNKLAKYAGVSKKIDGEEVYVYQYMFLITTCVGVFMTYIIISFAIDIAVRMFELAVLEILSPLFIATFVDEKSASSGPFSKWLKAVGTSYVSLYIKLAILALMTLLIMVINQSDVFRTTLGKNDDPSFSGWAKIFVIIGLLIFAKKAPKWIGDMIGIKSEGGLGGLSIGKKLGGMALAGGLATKGLEQAKKVGTGARGAMKKGIAGGLGGFLSTKGEGKLKNGFKGMVSGGITGARSGYQNGNVKGLTKEGWKTASSAAKGGRQSIFDKAGAKIKSAGEFVSGQGLDSLVVARARQVDQMKSDLIKKYGSNGAMEIMKKITGGKSVDLSNDTAFKNLTTQMGDSYKHKGISNEILEKSDKELYKETVLKQRESALSEIEDLIQRKSYDPANADDYDKKIAKLKGEGYFTDTRFGLEDISGKLDNNANLSELSNKNSKALSTTQKDIAARDAVKKETGEKK